MDRSFRQLLWASLPAALVGVANLGSQIRAVPDDPGVAWQLSLLRALGIAPDASGVGVSFATGALFWLPLLVVALAIGRGWGSIFARATGRPIDPIWLPAAWLFALVLPAATPLGMAAAALSFGLVFGCHVFGGTGRYLVNPVLLGVVFLGASYPALLAPEAMLPGGGALSTWSLVAATGIDVARLQGIELLDVSMGREVGAIGTTSALASLLGAGYLVAVRAASLPIVAGGIVGLIGAALAGASLPWSWHLALGHFAFALAFIATDATTCPTTRAGRWAFGLVFGVLTVVLRTANPSHPEGTWTALLLATLCIPLIDRIAQTLRRTARVAPDA